MYSWLFYSLFAFKRGFVEDGLTLLERGLQFEFSNDFFFLFHSSLSLASHSKVQQAKFLLCKQILRMHKNKESEEEESEEEEKEEDYSLMLSKANSAYTQFLGIFWRGSEEEELFIFDKLEVDSNKQAEEQKMFAFLSFCLLQFLEGNTSASLNAFEQAIISFHSTPLLLLQLSSHFLHFQFSLSLNSSRNRISLLINSLEKFSENLLSSSSSLLSSSSSPLSLEDFSKFPSLLFPIFHFSSEPQLFPFSTCFLLSKLATSTLQILKSSHSFFPPSQWNHFLNNFASVFPFDTQICVLICEDALIKESKPEKAFKLVDSACKTNPSDFACHLLKASLLLLHSKNKEDLALKVINQILQRMPHSKQLWNLLKHFSVLVFKNSEKAKKKSKTSLNSSIILITKQIEQRALLHGINLK